MSEATVSKVVLITGCSTGLGRISAEKCAQQGYKVYASMRDINGKNKQNAESLSSVSDNISIVEIDVSSEQSIQAAIGQILNEQERIDVLINNAGTMNVGLTEAFTIDQLQAQMDINYFGVARMFRAVLPGMRAHKSGLVITITSLAGRLIFPALNSYCSSKFAAEALAEGYRYELSAYGVDSVIIEPGPFATDLIDNSPKPKDQARLSAYGDFASMPGQVLNGFSEYIDAHKSEECDPVLVAQDIAKLIEIPFGQRPLRTVSGLDYGLRALNNDYAAHQKNVLEAMELQHLDPHSAA